MMTKKVLPGEGKTNKSLIINVDDLGMDYGGAEAFSNLALLGSVSSGSVMVPCPWFKQVVDLNQQNPEVKIGIHLTLTSEWSQYRWGPISTNDRSSKLIDNDGYFWKNRQLLRENLDVKTAEIELDAQMDKALNSGLRPIHIDCHMGVGFIPELVEFYIKLGFKYDLPVLLPRNIEDTLRLYKVEESNFHYYTKIIKDLEIKKYPLVDYFKITPCFETDQAVNGYKEIILNLEEGVTFLSIHANMDGSIKFIDPVKYQVRIDEYDVFKNNINKKWLEDNGVNLINFKDIK